MLRPFKLPAWLISATVSLILAGEIAAGTKPAFALLVAGTLVSIGITYNLLGGVSTLSGTAFACFASCTLVISQCAKVLLFEPADRTLESPDLTIQVYFVFYLANLIGTILFSRMRLNLPRPVEPRTAFQSNAQYAIALVVGLAASVVYEVFESSPSIEDRSSMPHSAGLALSFLLVFSLVVAVRGRIASTQGRHSFGLRAFIPSIAIVFCGFIETSRAHIALPAIVYGFTAYVSGYRFGKRHLAAACLAVLAFVFIVSPFEIYARGPMRELSFVDRLHEGYLLLTSIPAWRLVTQTAEPTSEGEAREQYFDRQGSILLNRLSAIRSDSNLINACASGFHYGFAALKVDAMRSLPRFLDKNKPDSDGASYTGRVTGINPDNVENGEFVITVISDSYGAFGWLGVLSIALFSFPFTFMIYESMFDFRKPWGIVAAGELCFQFSQVSMGGLVGLILRTPVTVLLLSYGAGMAMTMIPLREERRFSRQGNAAELDPSMQEYAP